MIHGQRKASAYGVGFTAEGLKIEEEFRQCCHCQHVWVYRPGSGIRRGWCLKHDAFVCGRDECINDQKKMVEDYEKVTGKVVSCLAWEELQDFKANQVARQIGVHGVDFELSPEGIIVPKELHGSAH